MEVFGNPEKPYHQAIIYFFKNSELSDAFLLFEFKLPKPFQIQIDLLVLRPNHPGLWLIEIKNKKIVKFSLNGRWEWQDRNTGQIEPVPGKYLNPYHQAMQCSDYMQDWLKDKAIELFPQDTQLIGFIRSGKHKVYPYVLVNEDSVRLKSSEEDSWAHLCYGDSELIKIQQRDWEKGGNVNPPILTEQHIREIINALELEKVELDQIQWISEEIRETEELEGAITEEVYPVDIQPIESQDEFLAEAKQATLYEFIDLIEENYDNIARWGGLPNILDEMGVQLLAKMINGEDSVSATRILLQVAHRHHWTHLAALLDVIGLEGFLKLLRDDNYERMVGLLSDLRQYQWAQLIVFEHILFQ